MKELKVGETWIKNGNDRFIIMMGNGEILTRRNDGSLLVVSEAVAAADWIKTHEADGSLVNDEETGERRRVICWDNYPATYPERNCFPGRRVSEAVGVEDFIEFEFEDGYRSRVSPTLYRHKDTGVYETVIKTWYSSLYDRVRAVAVILSKEGG